MHAVASLVNLTIHIVSVPSATAPSPTSRVAPPLAATWLARHSGPSTSAPLTPTELRVAKKPSPAFELISAAELEAVLRDRPVLILPRDSARPRIVLLER